ncbi:dCTP deaminase [Synechococcus elongatus]|nr:2'-deoxycytidine 5'-triphosphate deaminase [Synechococcus elongatus]WKW06295.1 2'-deoxycytidine 5'-triphosphate deaminase [Synechococcus elongatus PCC 7942 = FACHB-805]
MVSPFDPDLINPASLDVRLGPNIMIETPNSPSLQKRSIADYCEESPYLIDPSEWFLGETLELFNIPRSLAAKFVLKSSRAREGINHLYAGFADPRFHNSVLTLEIVNVRRFHPVPIWPGMLIGQLIFWRLSDEPERDYSVTGRYNDCLTVTASKDAGKS